MRRLIIHIGRHKTGTSALQFFLAKNDRFLKEQNIIYPVSGRGRKIAHHALQKELKEQNSTELKKMFLEISQESQDFENTIISSEAFQNVKDLSPIYLLNEHFDETIIVCYLRETLSYLISSYKQKVQAQNYTLPLETYLSKTKLKYQELLDRWAAVADHMEPRLYDSHVLKNGNIIHDFFDGLFQVNELPNSDVARNPSIGGNLLLYKLIRNALGISTPKDYLVLQKIAASHESARKKIFLCENIQESYRKNNKNNALLHSLFGDFPYSDFSKNEPWKIDQDFLIDVKKFNEFFEHKIPESKAISLGESFASQD